MPAESACLECLLKVMDKNISSEAKGSIYILKKVTS